MALQNRINHYTINEHLHRYSIWTAARAVQRSFTTTENISKAIFQSDLKTFSESKSQLTLEQFDDFQRKSAKNLKGFLEDLQHKEVSYGRASKIIAIYLKTSVIIGSKGIDPRAELIHPPIDSILLNNLSGVNGLPSLKANRWTAFTESDYWDLIDQIRAAGLPCNWKLETYWSPVKDIE